MHIFSACQKDQPKNVLRPLTRVTVLFGKARWVDVPEKIGRGETRQGCKNVVAEKRLRMHGFGDERRLGIMGVWRPELDIRKRGSSGVAQKYALE